MAHDLKSVAAFPDESFLTRSDLQQFIASGFDLGVHGAGEVCVVERSSSEFRSSLRLVFASLREVAAQHFDRHHAFTADTERVR